MLLCIITKLLLALSVSYKYRVKENIAYSLSISLIPYQLNIFGHLTKYLSLTVYTLLIVIETPRIYLGHYGNLSSRVPELAGFLMLTVLMQMPLVSFFLFNPYLFSTPMEITLHSMLWLLTIGEVVFGFIALKEASDFAKSIYLSQSRDR